MVALRGFEAIGRVSCGLSPDSAELLDGPASTGEESSWHQLLDRPIIGTSTRNCYGF